MDEDKRQLNPLANPQNATARAQLQPPNLSSVQPSTNRAGGGTSGIANPPRRKIPGGIVTDRGQTDTPDTNRAMAGGSDRLLRSQSKGQTGVGSGVGSGGVGHAAAARTGSNQQQNWY